MFYSFMKLGVTEIVVPVCALTVEEMAVTQEAMRGNGWFNCTEQDYLNRVGGSMFSPGAVLGTVGA